MRQRKKGPCNQKRWVIECLRNSEKRFVPSAIRSYSDLNILIISEVATTAFFGLLLPSDFPPLVTSFLHWKKTNQNKTTKHLFEDEPCWFCKASMVVWTSPQSTTGTEGCMIQNWMESLSKAAWICVGIMYLNITSPLLWEACAPKPK